MGGRGSGSGGGGGGGGKAVNAKMPELSGSAKQVAWAEDIRSSALKNIDSLVSSVADKSGLHGISFPGGGHVSIEAANAVKSFVVEGFQRVTSASAIINGRADFSYESIRRTMITAESQKRRGKL